MPVLDALLDLLFPPRCPFCGELLETGGPLCPNCRRDLPWLAGPAGERPVEMTAGCVSPLAYQGRVRQAVHDFKFHGKSPRGRAFGTLVAQCVRDHRLRAELVSWPPLSRERLRQRGYDQAQLLAREVGRQLGLPVLRTLTKEDRPAQSGLTEAAARRANLLGAYAAVEPDRFRGRAVLLVDDVVTTGATLSACARVLRDAGAGEVCCAALARAGAEDFAEISPAGVEMREKSRYNKIV